MSNEMIPNHTIPLHLSQDTMQKQELNEVMTFGSQYL